MNSVIKAIQPYFILFVLSYLLPFLYCGISQLWGEQGGTSSTLNYFELPLIIIIAFLLYSKPKGEKPYILHALFPLAPIFGYYIFFDVFFSHYIRAPRFTDLQNFPALFSVSLPLAISALILITLAFGPIFYVNIQSCFHGNKISRATSALRFSSLVVLFYFLFSPLAYTYQQNHLAYSDWSTTKNISKNGRISFLIFMHTKRNEMLASLKNNQELSISNLFYHQKPVQRPDIHVVVLESFLDPRKIKGLTFSPSPLHPGLSTVLLENEIFSLVKSPVYGGGTAQAEFEILTGIPALALVDSIEFNLFEGHKTSSFVEELNQLGYHTMASIGTRPRYYNSKVAYKGIGFQEITFLKEGYLQKSPDDEFIFDGDLLQANLQHLGKREETKPLFNYIVGMYGHLPYKLNRLTRPDVIQTNSKAQSVEDITNQFYYRTEALAQFIENIQKTRHDSIILIISDHLPPIFKNDIKYRHSFHSNISLLTAGGHGIDITGAKYFEIPHIIWNILNKSTYPADMKNHVIHTRAKDIYYSYVREAMAVPSNQ